MKCPSCQIAMDVRMRCEVGYEQCPQCGGVWLDSGELDSILVRLPKASDLASSADLPRRYTMNYERYRTAFDRLMRKRPQRYPD